MNFIKEKIGKGLHVPQLAEKTREFGREQVNAIQLHFPYIKQRVPPRRMTEKQRKKLVYKIERISRLMDNSIPWSPIPIGIGSILGFIPFIGGTIGGLLSLYQIYLSCTLGIPLWLILQMLLNILIVYLASLIPFFGGLFTTFYKSNTYNYQDLRQWLDNPPKEYIERVKQGERRPSSSGYSPPGEITWTQLSSDVRHKLYSDK